MSETAARAHPGYCQKCGSERKWLAKPLNRAVTQCVECRRRTAARQRAKHGGAAAYNKIWETQNREKALAHKAVEYAIRTGKLQKQSCERCGSSDAHAHHDDYSKRLEVMWLCPIHHKDRHRELASAVSSPAAATSPSRSSPRDGDTNHEAAQ